MWQALIGLAASYYMNKKAQQNAMAQQALASMNEKGLGASEPTANALMGTGAGEGTSEPQSLLPQSIPQTPQNLTTQQTANDPSKLAMGASSQPDSSDRILDLLARNATNYQPAAQDQGLLGGVRTTDYQPAAYPTNTYTVREDYNQAKTEDETGNNESTLQMAALAAQVGSSMYQPPPSGGLMYSRGGSNPTVPDARARLQQILAASRRRR